MSTLLTAWFQASVDGSALEPAWIVIDREFAARLTTVHRREFEHAARNTLAGPELLTGEVPNLEQAQLDTLDQSGLVRVGEQVGPGSVLIGRATPQPGEVSPEEKLLRAIFGEVVSGARDSSLRCPPGCFGTVCEARVIEPREGERARARVTIEWERPLSIGDELQIEAGPQVIVAKIDSLVGDVAWSGGTGPIRLAKISMAKDVIHGRSIGPYSRVTQRPLPDKEQFGGQLLAREQARRLAASAPWALWEMCTIKSDAVEGRTRAYSSLVRLENPASMLLEAPPESAPAADMFSFLARPALVHRDGEMIALIPESITVMARELAALGLEVRFESERVGVRLLGSEELRERSRGRVTKPETINYRTLAPEPDGLFCQRVFGPSDDYKCACGKYQRMKHRGTVCEACGVEVTHSSVRRERFGHIELAASLVHPLFLTEVAVLLGLSLTRLRKVLAGTLALDERERSGPAAICEALAEVELDRLESAGSKPARKLAASMRERGLSPLGFVVEVVLVLPADLRPLVPLDDGRFASSDFNDLYAKLINRNNRTRRLLELAAPPVIISGELIKLQEQLETVFANEQRKKPRRCDGRFLRSLLGSVQERVAELGSKHVDYSAVARLIADPEVPPGACRIPRSLATELFRPIAYGLMQADGQVDNIQSAKQALLDRLPFALEAVERACRDYPVLLMGPASVIARTVLLWDEAAIAVDPATARLLDTLDVTLHVPLTDEAKAECLALDDDPPPSEAHGGGWLGRAHAEPSALLQQLRGAVIEGELDLVEDPLLRAALGRAPR